MRSTTILSLICPITLIGCVTSTSYSREEAGLDQVPTKDIPGNATSISLKTNNIKQLHKQEFPFPDCLELYLDNNQISTIQNGSFTGLTNIKKLTINENNLTEVTAGMLEGLESLKDLFLVSNSIAYVEPHTFLHLSMLTFLDLSHNELKEIRLDMMVGLVSLHRLHIINNKVNLIEPGAFVNCSDLGYLHVPGNSLTHVTRDMWNGLENSLYALYLHNNKISVLDQDLFTGLKKLSWVTLHENQLRSFPWYIFRPEDFPRSETLLFSMSDNPIHCDKSWCWVRLAASEGWFRWEYYADVEKYKPQCSNFNGEWDGLYLNCTLCDTVKQEVCSRVCATIPGHQGELYPLLDCPFGTYDCRCIKTACSPVNQTACSRECESSDQEGELYQLPECPADTMGCTCQDKDSSTGLIVGLCVGLLILLILVIILVMKRKSIRRHCSQRMENYKSSHQSPPAVTGVSKKVETPATQEAPPIRHSNHDNKYTTEPTRASIVPDIAKAAAAKATAYKLDHREPMPTPVPPVPPPRPEDYEEAYALKPRFIPGHNYLTLVGGPEGESTVDDMGRRNRQTDEDNDLYLEPVDTYDDTMSPYINTTNTDGNSNADGDVYQPVEMPKKTTELYENV